MGKRSMIELFGVSKNHSIKRNDRNQRGFSCVCFRDQTLLGTEAGGGV
jgi:hypothetical protein